MSVGGGGDRVEGPLPPATPGTAVPLTAASPGPGSPTVLSGQGSPED